MWKYLHDSLRYLYENPLTNYSHFIVAIPKAEMEYKQDKHNNSAHNYMMKSGVVPDNEETPVPEALWAELKAM